MFTILKLLKPFILPPMLIFIGLILGIALIKKRQRTAKIIFFVTLAVYYILSIQPTAYLLSRSLEYRVIQQRSFERMADAEAIVVLAGGMNKQEGRVPFDELGGVSLKRLWRGIQVYRELKGGVPLLYSGGSGDPFDTVSKEAELAKQYAILMGIPEENFWIESSSRDTYESALAVKHFLEDRFPEKDQRQIVLVTSASHIPRSLGVMEKAGISVIPAPADFSQGMLKLNPLSFFPSHAYFSSTTTSIHEWIGIAGYKIRGRI